MTYTAGIDVGSTYTKAAVVSDAEGLLATGIRQTGFKLEEAAGSALDMALEQADLTRGDLAYVATTGYGRNQITFRDVQATDLTAQAWGSRYFFPDTKTVLDVGGQTMKAMRLDERGKGFTSLPRRPRTHREMGTPRSSGKGMQDSYFGKDSAISSDKMIGECWGEAIEPDETFSAG